MSLASSLRRHLLTGTLVLVPVAVTLWLVFLIASFVVKTLHLRIFRLEYLEVLPESVWLRALLSAAFEVGNFLTGLVITLVLIALVGVLVRTLIGKRLIAFWESIIGRIPFIRGIYGAAKQLTEAVLMTGEKSFSRVVLIEYPRKGLYCIGFVTGQTGGEVATKFEGKKMLNIFVPSTPNPTTGYYMILPESDVIPLDISAEDAFRMIISGGLSIPENHVNSKG